MYRDNYDSPYLISQKCNYLRSQKETRPCLMGGWTNSRYILKEWTGAPLTGLTFSKTQTSTVIGYFNYLFSDINISHA